MALPNAHIDIVLDRSSMRFSVAETSTRILTRDENIGVTVSGWTRDEVLETDGTTPYEPFFQIILNGIVLAECALKGSADPEPVADGTYAMTGVLSTNTAQMIMAFAGTAYETMRQFTARIFQTTAPNPIANGYVDVWNFPAPCGMAPKELPSASEVLRKIGEDLSSHVHDNENPHDVTPEQIGAARESALNELDNRVSSIHGDVEALKGLSVGIQANIGQLQSDVSALWEDADTKMDRNAVKNAVSGIGTPKATLNDLKNTLTTLISALKGIS